MSDQKREGVVQFGSFELDPETAELWRRGEPFDLPPQPARLLALLVRNPGRIVTRERIRDEIWIHTVVEFDQAINNAVRQVRAALGDDASSPRFVETVPRRGYRFIAEVEPSGSVPDQSANSPDRARHRVLRGWGVGVAAVCTLIVGTVSWFGLQDPADDATVLAVVPARAAEAGSTAENVADTLTSALTDALNQLDADRIRVVPWTWDVSYDRGTGAVERDGEPTRVDFVVEANVYTDADIEVRASVTSLREGRQVWYRRYRHAPDDVAGTVAAVTRGVGHAIREGLPVPPDQRTEGFR